MLNVTIDPQVMARIVESLHATEQQTTLALSRALNKTALWLRTQATREIAHTKQIPQKLIRNRIEILRALRRKLRTDMHLYIGGIAPEKIGRIRQTSKGARVRSHQFDGAFIATMPQKSKHSIYKRKGKARLPIQRMYVPIAEEAQQMIEQLLDQKLVERFEVVFYRELDFIVSHK